MAKAPRLTKIKESDLSNLEPISSNAIQEESTLDSRELVNPAPAATNRALLWQRTSFLNCAIAGIAVSLLNIEEARAVSSIISDISISQVEAKSASLESCKVSGVRLGAANAYEASLRDVIITGCKIDYLNLRSARLRDVRFTDCVIGDFDAVGSQLTRVAFENSSVRTLSLQKSQLEDVDLRGAKLSEIVTVADLGGATLSHDQVLQLSSALASHLGICEE